MNDGVLEELGPTQGRGLRRLWTWARVIILAVGVSLFGVGCGARVDPNGDSSTHFWRTCDADAECGDSYECICGRCTLQCASPDVCPGAASHCASVSVYLTCDRELSVCIPETEQQWIADAGQPRERADGGAPAVASSSEPTSGPGDSALLSTLDHDAALEITNVSSGVDTSLAELDATSSGEAQEPPKFAWAPPSAVDESPLSAGSVVSSADGDGNLLAVWTESELGGTGASIAASFYSAKVGWETPTRLVTSDVSLVTLCVDSSTAGSAIVAWLEEDLGAGAVWGATFSDVSGWSEPVQLGPVLANGGEIDCVMDEQGMATVAWGQYTGSDHVMHAARIAADGLAPSYQLIGGNTYGVFHVSAAVDGNGNVSVLWVGAEDSVEGLWSARFTAKGWQPPLRVNTTPAAMLPDHAVALLPDGSGRAAWIEQSQGVSYYQIQSSSFSASAGWGEPETLATGEGFSGLIRVGVDSSGNALVSWDEMVPNELEGQTPNVRLSHYSIADGWHELGAEDGLPAQTDAERPSLSMSASGHALVAWRRFRGDYTGEVVAAHFSPATGWVAALEFDQTKPTFDMTWPAVAVGETGTGGVVWVQSDPLSPSGDVFGASWRE